MIGVDLDRLPERALGLDRPAGGRQRDAASRMSAGEGRLQSYSPVGRGEKGFEIDRDSSMHVQVDVALRDPGQRAREFRVQLGRAHEHPTRELVGWPDMLAQQVEPAQIVVVGLDVGRRLTRQCQPLRLEQPDLERLDNAARDLVLHGEDVGQRAVVALGPDLTTRRGIDHPHREAKPLPRSADAAFQHVTNSEAGTRIDRRACTRLQCEARLTRRHEQPGNLRQLGDQVFGNTFGESCWSGSPPRFTNGGTAMDGQSVLRPASRVTCQASARPRPRKRAMGGHPPSPRARQGRDREAGLIADLLADDGRDSDATRRGYGFEARSQVDAIAVDVTTIGDDVTEVDADPKEAIRRLAAAHALRRAIPRWIATA